jgi:plasmid stabilization system protein ParE
MKVVVREAAALDLDAIFEWIAKDSPRAARFTNRRV